MVETAARVGRADIALRVARIIRDVAGLAPSTAIEREHTLGAGGMTPSGPLALDCIDHVEIQVECEEFFGIAIPDALSASINTVGHLADFIAEKLGIPQEPQ